MKLQLTEEEIYDLCLDLSINIGHAFETDSDELNARIYHYADRSLQYDDDLINFVQKSCSESYCMAIKTLETALKDTLSSFNNLSSTSEEK